MLLSLAARRRVLVVGGKGGVGKTSVASAVALDQARTGRRVLLVSTDPAHNLAHLWGVPVGDQGARVAPRLEAVEIDPARATASHLAAVRETLRRAVPEHLTREVDRHLELARDAPGMHEAAVLERLGEVIDRGAAEADLVVVDTAPSGHTAHLLGLPEQMGRWTDGLLRRHERTRRLDVARANLGDEEAAAVLGPARAGRFARGARARGRESRGLEIREVLERRRALLTRLRGTLTDPSTTAFVVVLVAEHLPVLESVELVEQLGGTGVPVAGLVVNRRSPAQGDLLTARRAVEDGQLAAIRSALPGVPLVEVPLLAGEVVGVDGVERLADVLQA
ncbi:ArsA family ATPase [Actinotalea sp. BY-33]|uniref:ArsA family ATPase n=1 Tax=Actinotalea soli TaxID=2819234 RepID=A0A939RSM4_9CELL|nr:ArsA family ATPase [Actinotalea soli]MBO1751837.1 ArsA family ATPase [Actinotalea soli]